MEREQLATKLAGAAFKAYFGECFEGNLSNPKTRPAMSERMMTTLPRTKKAILKTLEELDIGEE
ncbi:MAG: hypothetical protein COV69_04415 [Parcubacteria group bacterium CG11_big_fil_rev_8_21_14_0_20_39_14]|nr:MAG: hypothetical protein COV69_04415 [Parcubacteria group bacterium CG11_big_fil_rev_8_21_14_0_20_39_14]PIS35493.1 MAG: hypothetical protein COT36_02065 [Parcubacteria group bacterium CG08_land_8_20_14_0_20_38_56]